MPKYLGFGDNGEPQFVDAPVQSTHEDGEQFLQTRISSAFTNWRWAREQNDEKYKVMAQQSFEHLLVALDDLFALIKGKKLTEGEQKELAAFIGSLK